MNRPALRTALDALTPIQCRAFGLLLGDLALAAVEPRDRARAARMSAATARQHLFVPRIEPLLARWWRGLLGQPEVAEAPADAASASVTHLVPEGSLAQRYGELHSGDVLLPGDAPDLYLRRLASSTNDDVVTSAILIVEIAGDIVARAIHRGSDVLRNVDYALIEFYEAAAAMDRLDADARECITLAAGFDGTPESANDVRGRARELGRRSFGAR